MSPFGSDFAEALGAEFHLQGFTTAFHAIVHEHEQCIFATLCTLNPEFKDTVFHIGSQVYRTGNTNSDTRIVTCNKFNFHRKSSFHGVLIREYRFGVFTRILVGIATTTRNSFAHDNGDNFLIRTERLRILHDKVGLVAVAIIAKTVASERR